MTAHNSGKAARKGRSGIEVQYYKEGDEQQLNDLFNLVFQKDRPLSVWRWKFSDNPFLSEILITTAVTDDGKVVGMYPFLNAEYKVGDNLGLAVQCVEIAMHPKFRGRWTIIHLKEKNWEKRAWEKHISEKMIFGFGFPTDKHARLGQSYMNYNFIGDLPILGFRFNWGALIGNRTIRRLIGKFVSLTGYIYNYLHISMWGRATGGNGEIDILESPDFGDKYDRLWEKVSGDYKVMANRSSRYLGWRYADNPMAEFTTLEARCAGELVGYLVYTTLFENGEKNGYIFDIFCRKNEPAGKLLLKRCLLKLMRERIKTVRCGALTHTPIYSYLSDLGFEKLPTSPPVYYELLNPDDSNGSILAELDNWYLGIGDTDLLGW